MVNINKGIELARKVQKLVEQGIDGEKENAKLMLDGIFKKYNLTLNDILDEPKQIYWFSVKKYEQKLLNQIVSSIVGIDYKSWRRNDSKRGFELTKSEYQDVKLKFRIYSKEYKKQEGIFYAAFIQKNELYAKPNDKKEKKELTYEELIEIQKILSMMEGIDKTNINKELKR